MDVNRHFLQLTVHIFLTLLTFFGSTPSFAQTKSTKILAVDNYCRQLDADTIVIKENSKAIPQDVCVCDAFDFYTRNDSIVKVTTWSLHVSIGRCDYYYKCDTLIYARFTKTYGKETRTKKEYYFDKGSLIKVEHWPNENNHNKQEEKNTGTYIFSTAKEILKNLKIKT